jgi:hypothetical protein
LGPEVRGLGDDELDGDALDRHAKGTAWLALENRDDRRQPRECVEHGLGLLGGAHDGEIERGVGPAARIARDLAVELARDLLEQSACAVEQHPFALGPPFTFQAFEDSPLRLRPDPGGGRQPSSTCRLAKLVGGGHSERAADLDHPFRPDAEEPSEPDQLRLHLALELLELGDASRLDELAQARGDAGPDPAQLLDPAGGDELGDRRLRLANRLGGAAICTRRVVAGARQVEEGCERLELLGDVGVCHGVSLAAWRRS